MGTQSVTHPPPRIEQGRLWFGTVAGAAAWALHGFTSFLISTQACKDGNGNWGPLPAASVRLLLGGVTLLFLGVAVAGGLTSLRNWRQLSQRRHVLNAEGLGREDFMALIGVFVSTVFVLGILWAGIPPILVDVCVNAR
jgi:hypothetical protein